MADKKIGFTTGSCCAAAAKASTYMLLSGTKINDISIITPAGIEYRTELLDIEISNNYVNCAIKKNSGDDPDITNGALIYAKATLMDDNSGQVYITADMGVGKVTREGLDQPVGEYAINSVPRRMITEEVRSVLNLFDDNHSIEITISVPEGEELARKTFNSRLGIEGGISIIGTTGIVEPMSSKAIVDTIKLELNIKSLESKEHIVITPGNYGLDFMKETYNYDLNRAVKCSNFIGETVDEVVQKGFETMLLVGHAGKLVKVSGGIMDTHSRVADCRMELMAVAAYKAGASGECIDGILKSLSTEEAWEYVVRESIDKECGQYIVDRICYHLNERAKGKLHIECIMYSVKWGLMGKTKEAEKWLQ